MTTTTECPGKWPVALQGRGFTVDYTDEFYSGSLQMLGAQQDTGSRPGENSLSREDLWRRSVRSFHHGAGQDVFDAADSDPFRFRRSRGVNVWNRNRLQLLQTTVQIRSSTASPLLAVAGTRLYAAQGSGGTGVQYTTNGTAYTNVTGQPATRTWDVTSDGFNVYTAFDTAGIYRTDTTTDVGVSYATGNVRKVGYVSGRLMAAYNNLLYNVTAAGALPAPLLTHLNTDFQWVGFAGGNTHIYCAGYSGDQSTIYKTTITADGVALGVPTIAATLPKGEVVTAIFHYLGYLMIGVKGFPSGVRVAQIDGSGNLTFGQTIPVTSLRSVGAFHAEGRFVYYSWNDFETNVSGLGRLDLSTFTAPLTPAYASDLMVPLTGDVVSIVRFLDRITFTLSGAGIYWADGYLTTGYVDSGHITFDISDAKIPKAVDVILSPVATGAGSVTTAISADRGALVTVGTSTNAADNTPTFVVSGIVGSELEIRNTITGDGTGSLMDLLGFTVRAQPVPGSRGKEFLVPLILAEVVDVNGSDVRRDVADDETFLEALLTTTATVEYQDGEKTYNVFVSDVRFRRSAGSKTFFRGVALCRLKRLG